MPTGQDSHIHNTIIDKFGNRLRIRASGIAVVDEKILLIKHTSLNNSYFWSPPGGGCEYGESVVQCVRREFKEETGLEVEVGNILFLNEFLREPLHALELFFQVTVNGGTAKLGIDPELPSGSQIIHELKFFTITELAALEKNVLHNILHNVTSLKDLETTKCTFTMHS